MSKKEKTKANERKRIKIKNVGKASLNGLKCSAGKVRIIARSIKNKHVEKALISLKLEKKRAAKYLARLLNSAIANASNNGLNIDNLFIHDIQVNKGATQKRIMYRAQGRTSKIQKQSSNIKINLLEKSKR